MKIVVLDGFALNPGDLSWEGLHALGPAEIHDRTHAPEILVRARGATAILTNKTPLTRETLAQLPELRYIGVLATGYNVVDIGAAREMGIPVTNIPTYGTDSVAQHVFALLLNHTNRVAHHAQGVAGGAWSRSSDWSYWDRPLVELAGLTMGVVGFGRIGRQVARLAEAFGMHVIWHDPFAKEPGSVPLETLFTEADVVSLHAPQTPENVGFVNAALLKTMKPTAILINTARGGLIQEADLAEALRAGCPAAALLDVLSSEPPPADHPLMGLEAATITPHQAWATVSARRRLLETAVENLRAWIEGRPQNVVN